MTGAAPRTTRSASATGGGPVSLPVLEQGASCATTIRPSRSGRRRAIVLGLVQLAMIVHIVLWLLSRRYGWFGGATTTPIEPSESMEFVKDGVVNAGLIFFVVALLSTLVLGRWFCGWGCHLVLLQDLCGWIMKKCGVRPKPFRSRLLVYVPLVLAIYMFIWPAVYRWGHRLGESLGWIETTIPRWHLSWELTTTDFWHSFAGVLVAIPFLGICGFAAVYFLGAKGFCTYGCPYGGFFAPVDRLSPGRIRVTDACEHCGHCTAVCTSNVRVHDEVRAYGMVVDPGCMKCLDCVSVCPNDALYFGFGVPAVRRPAADPPPRRTYDLTWPEEIGFTAVFVASFIAWRGVYGVIPMLMAAGIAGCVTFLAWKGWRLVRDRDVSFTRRRLKFRGRLTGGGAAFAALVVVTLAGTLHSGLISTLRALAQHHDDRVTVGRQAVLSGQAYEPKPEVRHHAERGARYYRLASGFGEGGLGFPAAWQPDVDMRIAWLQAAGGDLAAAEQTLRAALARDGPSDRFCSNILDLMRASGDRARAASFARPLLLEHAGFTRTLDTFVRAAAADGELAAAIDLCRARLERFQDDLPTLRWLALLQLQSGASEDGIATLQQVLRIVPDDVGGRRTLAVALAEAGRLPEALEQVQAALDAAPELADLHLLAARMLVELGRMDVAEGAVGNALEIAPDSAEVCFEAAGILSRMGKADEASALLQRSRELADRGSSGD